MNNSTSVDFLVNKSNLKEHQLVPSTSPESINLLPGEVLLRIEHFALTSNNITYGAFGDAMKYWEFFPAPNNLGWGRIPVWGFATVVRHNTDDKQSENPLNIGERIYGYFPMSSYLVVKPGKISPLGFSDTAEHRAALHPIYNQYRRCNADRAYQLPREAQQMLVQPLFLTSFLIEDFLFDQNHFDASQVIITSASSKTAYSLAYMIKFRNDSNDRVGPKIKIIGLTSKANAIFVNAMGVYDQVVMYEDLPSINAHAKSVIVDMAGNASVRAELHRHLGESLTYSCAVGGTHWDALSAPGKGAEIPGPRPVLFFAPAQSKKRAAEWGPEVLQQRIGKAWLNFQPTLDEWMHVIHGQGPQAVVAVYENLLNGQAKADQGYVLSL